MPSKFGDQLLPRSGLLISECEGVASQADIRFSNQQEISLYGQIENGLQAVQCKLKVFSSIPYSGHQDASQRLNLKSPKIDQRFYSADEKTEAKVRKL